MLTAWFHRLLALGLKEIRYVDTNPVSGCWPLESFLCIWHRTPPNGPSPIYFRLHARRFYAFNTAITKFILNISGRTSPLWQYAAPGVLIENVTLLPNAQCPG